MLRVFLIILIIIGFFSIISCEKDEEIIQKIVTAPAVKAVRFINKNEEIIITYEGDLIKSIYKSREFSLPENPNTVSFYENKFEIDTFNFQYEKDVLIQIEHLEHNIKFNGVSEEIKEVQEVQYNNDGKIESISFAGSMPGKVVYSYDEFFRIIKEEKVYDSEIAWTPPFLFKYDNNSNVVSYCLGSFTNCSTAKVYDNSPNPYQAINLKLGYNFFNKFQQLSYNNPLRFDDVDKALNIVHPSFIEFSYIYDDLGRTIFINDFIEVQY